MRRVVYLAALVMAIITVALFACAKPAPAPTPTPTQTPKPTSATTPTLTTQTPKLTSSVTASPKPPNRQGEVEAGAKSEGTIVYWAADAQDAPKYLVKFKELYPWLKVETWQATPAVIAEKLISEAKAGKHSADVISIAEEVIVRIPSELLEKYEWPTAAKYPPDTFAKDGLYLRPHAAFFGPTYNSNIVSPAMVPTSWENLKDPKWKGKTVATTDAEEAPLMLANLWSTGGKLDWEKSFSFWREVFKNTEPKRVKGYSTPTQLLGAGEFGLFIYNSGGIATRERVGGLPVEIAPVGSLPAKNLGLAILKNAPHPNAARLFVDYRASVEGSTMFSDATFILSNNPEVRDALLTRILKEKGIQISMLSSALMTPENVKKSGDFWKEITQ